MKVYVIIYDNGEEYDYDEQIVAVVSSREKAEEYKANENVVPYWYPYKRIEEFILDEGE